MADRYDGSIRIKAEADTKPAEKELQKLRDKLGKQTEQVDKQAAAVRRLKAQYEQLASGNVSPKGITQMERALKKAQAEAAKLDAEYQKVNSVAQIDRSVYGAAAPERQARMDELAQQMAQADAKADALNRKLEQLRINPGASEDAKRLEESLRTAEKRLVELQTAAGNTKSQISDLAAQSTSGFAKAGGRLRGVAQTIKGGVTHAAQTAGKAVVWLKDRVTSLGRNKGFDKAGKSAQRFANRLKSIVAGALFFNIISRGLTALTQQIGKYLTANQRFSNALSGIKSNLLTAFQPIYDAVLPALNAMMESLERVTAQFAAFIATIFGTTAQQAQENADALYDQANATEEVGKEAKKAEKYLASFDTIEKIGKEETTAGDAAKPEFDTDFGQVAVPQWLLDFWKAFQDSWDQYGATTMQAFSDTIQRIKDLIASIGETFMSIWTGGTGLEFLNLLQQGLQVILGIIGDIAAAFTTAWNSEAGQTVIENLFYALNSILELIISIGNSFREAWNDGSGIEICTAIHEIISDIFEVIENLANRLREAWESNDTGVEIWNSILDIIQLILDGIHKMTEATVEWSSGINFEPLLDAFDKLLEAVQPVVDAIMDGLAWAYENILLPLATWCIEEVAPASIDILTASLEALRPVLEAIGNLFEALWPVIRPIAEFLGTVLVIALNAVADAMEAVGEVLAWIINLLSQIAGTAIDKVSKWFGVGAYANYSSAEIQRSQYSTLSLPDNYPRLANGAVISPNSEFLAVLGDQRSGTNIETPLATMKQAFMEAMAEMGGGAGETTVTVNFEGSLSQLARILEPKILVETSRKGASLITGGAY